MWIIIGSIPILHRREEKNGIQWITKHLLIEGLYMQNTENEWKKRILANGMNEYDYLCNITIMYVSFEGTDSNDHAHCELCWDKFSNNATDLHNGYITLDKKIWLCPECVHDFRKLFHWTVKNDPPK